MPRHATWDTHVHLFDPQTFPFAKERSYTPGHAGAEELLDTMREGGVSSVVLVQPSVYGNDNACLLDALATLRGRALGVAVVNPAMLGGDQIAEMHARGVRGFRVNLMSGGEAPGGAGALEAMASALAGSGMFLQVYAPIDRIVSQFDTITQAGVPIVLDHFAGIGTKGDVQQVIDLMERTANAPVWIKMSADYKLGTDEASTKPRAMSLIRACVSLRPDNVIWGSDWPHTGGGGPRATRAFGEIEPFRDVDSRAIPKMFAACGLTETEIAKIMCDNPARLMEPDEAP